MKEKDILIVGVISWLVGLPGVFYMEIESLIYMYFVIILVIFIIYWIYKRGTSKFEVLKPRVEIERVFDRVSRVSMTKTEKRDVETKTICIDIKNKNPDADLSDCKIGIATKMDDWSIMNLENLIPDISQKIHLFRLFPNSSVVSPFESKNGVKLDVGNVYNISIRFFGGKFTNKKLWRMKLNLTSWDNCGLYFKTRRDVLKERIGWRKDKYEQNENKN